MGNKPSTSSPDDNPPENQNIEKKDYADVKNIVDSESRPAEETGTNETPPPTQSWTDKYCPSFICGSKKDGETKVEGELPLQKGGKSKKRRKNLRGKRKHRKLKTRKHRNHVV